MLLPLRVRPCCCRGTGREQDVGHRVPVRPGAESGRRQADGAGATEGHGAADGFRWPGFVTLLPALQISDAAAADAAIAANGEAAAGDDVEAAGSSLRLPLPATVIEG